MATLQVNGTISPPLTPALESEVTGLDDGVHLKPDLGRPVTPQRPISPQITPDPTPPPRTVEPFHNTEQPAAAQKVQPMPPLGILNNEIPVPVVEQTQTSQTASQARTKTSSKKSKVRSTTADDRLASHPRISKPVELLRGSYDVVVIGSGYGGGVAASRMARTGQSVCVLERGKERWPGEYPERTVDTLKELHVSGVLAPGTVLKGKTVEEGDPTGMYHMIVGRGQNAIVANGLGGTSLINANVFMPADKRTLAMSAWPPEIRNNVDELDAYYKKVEEVLEPEEYPDDFPKLKKLEMLKTQAEALGYGDKFHKVRQTTRFRDGPNSCGYEMMASKLTGQDATGVNDGSKNTTLVTYLADAWNWGAEMFCGCEVRYIEKLKNGDGYLVYFAWHGRSRGRFKENIMGDLMWVHAKKAVFLGAGSIATTEILLRSKAMGLDVSDEVGQGMSGNGDILAFGYNTDKTVNAIGRDGPKSYDPVGPCITGVIDCRTNTANPLDGFVIEEGAVPHALANVLQFMLDHMPGSVKGDGGKSTVLDRTQATLSLFGSKVLGPYFKGGAIQKTQIYLIMSHDSNQAVLSLEDDKPVLEFQGVARSNHVKYLNGLLAKATEAVGGTLVQNPWYALMGQEVTVHPVGGACMASDGTGKTGVTNHVGAVFMGEGKETHDGLIVTDAAVIPTALGANPFATISALAERSVEAYAKSKNLSISTEKNSLLNLFGEPQHLPDEFVTPPLPDSEASFEATSLSQASEVVQDAIDTEAAGMGFTEVMSGFVHYDKRLKADDIETYKLAYRIGESRCENARFFLSVQAFDLDKTLHHHQHRGMLTGTFVCPAIPGSPFMVQRGEFNLFALDNKAPGTRNLTYDFDMKGTDGRKLHFHGYKVVDASVALSPKDLWRATTTLYITVSEHTPGLCANLDDEDAWRRGTVLAKGILHINMKDFKSEVETMVPTGSSTIKRLKAAASFLTFFTRNSLGLLLAPFSKLQYPSQSYDNYNNPTEPDRSLEIVASDGVKTYMKVWEPTSIPGGDPANIRNLFMIPGASVDHQIYALPTIPFNAVNYFARAGYRVFVSVHRIGQLKVAEQNFTTYDTRLDLRACLERIRSDYGGPEQKIYIIAHCMGSVALSAGMLDGTVPADWISGVTCSQVFMNPIWGPANMAKVMAGPVPMDRLYTLLAGSWFDCETHPDDSLVQRAINQLLRLYPQSRKEMCSNAACHRASLVFGRCWNHRNLNEATHRQIDRFFGGVNMTLLRLLMRQGKEGHVMTNDFEPLDTPGNVERLRGLPFLLFVGRDNAVLSTEATERTYEALCDTFGTDGGRYRRRVVHGYGHLDPWMGRNAWKDVYPFVREEVDRVVRGEGYVFEEPDDRFARMKREGVVLY
ncbi:cholesterol oxidase [Echria macrotheca]|uniref:Cholesterol oxidase n=1 Tax=Echria macrotheca TaxID=438768 RepID=A0AAJ0BLF1_9PEZI|nr:cholesterol oxidase [Echria macrotheca]